MKSKSLVVSKKPYGKSEIPSSRTRHSSGNEDMVKPPMKWSRKWTRGCLALALLAAGLAIWHFVMPAGSNEIITLSDGHQYRFAGTSWGTNHIPPGVLPYLADHLPNSWVNYLRAKLGPRRWFTSPLHTPEALVIWLEPTGTSANVPFAAGGTLGLQGVLVDKNGLAGSTPSFANFLSPAGESVFNDLKGPPGYVFLSFPVPPRRSRTLECRLQEIAGVAYTVVRPDLGRLKFPNPLFGHYPQWQPGALPAVKSAGDLQVRLNNFGRALSAGSHAEMYQFSVTFESSRDRNEKWTVAGLEVTDATGNRISQDVRNSEGPDTYGIYGALWPDEAAVRLTLTLKRTSGYPASELVTFTNLPVLLLGPSYAPPNGTSLTNSLGGIPIAVRNIMTDTWHQRHASLRGAYGVELETPTHPPGVIADIVEVATDAGNVLTPPDSVGPYARTYIEYHQGPAPAAKYLNVNVAVQKTRTVEFLVRP